MVGKLGDLLVNAQLITPDQREAALRIQRQEGGRLGTIVVGAGFCSDPDVVGILGLQHGVPAADLGQWPPIDPTLLDLVPRDLAQRHRVLPLQRSGDLLTLAMADPTDAYAMEAVRFHTGCHVHPVVSSELGLTRAMARCYDGAGDSQPVKAVAPFSQGDAAFMGEAPRGDDGLVDLGDLDGAHAPVVNLVNRILMEAIERRASDIHIEPFERSYRVRLRVDGILREVLRPSLRLRDALTSRIKIMAKLNIAERRLPQDGRIKLQVDVGGQPRVIDFRVSVLPTLFGEKVALRLLDSDKLVLDLTKLGFEPESLERWDRQISKPYGLVLVTGPTGSGKTNTLYSSVAKLNTPETNILTAEDPVEFNFPGINQLQVKEQIGLTFAVALRSFLRQDPNIILVGEIRDLETAEIAIKASLTGHLVLSTLHTNDAPSTIVRLMNMGVEPFLVATSLNVICAQRLVRRLCPHCRVEDPPGHPEEALLQMGFTPEEVRRGVPIHRAVGCEACDHRGYRGRVGLCEVLEISDALRNMILVGATSAELREQGQREGMITLRRSGCRKVLEGVTTLEEIIRETVV